VGGGAAALSQRTALAGEAGGAGAGQALEGAVIDLSGNAGGHADVEATMRQLAGVALAGRADGAALASPVLRVAVALWGRADGAGAGAAIEGAVRPVPGRADGAGAGEATLGQTAALRGAGGGVGGAGAVLTRTRYIGGRADGVGGGVGALSQRQAIFDAVITDTLRFADSVVARVVAGEVAADVVSIADAVSFGAPAYADGGEDIAVVVEEVVAGLAAHGIVLSIIDVIDAVVSSQMMLEDRAGVGVARDVAPDRVATTGRWGRLILRRIGWGVRVRRVNERLRVRAQGREA
jgi:hypothetical protein